MMLFKDKFKIESQRFKNWDYSSEAIYFITLVTQNRKCIFGSIEDEKMILNKNGQIIETELLKSIKIRKDWFFHNWIVMPNHIHLLIEIQNNEDSNTQSLHTQIVETHSSASTPSISTIQNVKTNVAETHCCTPLQNQSVSKLSRKPNSISSFVAVFKSVTTKQINDLYIVETHSSASTSGTSTKIAANGAETHCCAPLHIQTVNINAENANQSQSIIANKKIWQSNYHDHIVRNYKTFETIYNYIKSNPRLWETDSINANFQ